MRRLLLLGALCAMSVLAITPAAGAVTYAYGSCAEMPTQVMAQGTLDDPTYGEYGTDKDELNLDPDGDGVACNNPGNLVGGQYEAQYGQPETPTQGDRSCVDFASQKEAQAAFDADLAGLDGLDADGDGVACESTGSPADGITFEDGSAMIEDSAAPGPTGQEAPKLNAGDQYAPQNSVVDVVEEAAEDAAEGAPDAAGSLSASREARADEQVAEKEGTPSSEGGAGEGQEANAYGGIAELPATGGVSLLALGAGALLVAGGLVAHRIIR